VTGVCQSYDENAELNKCDSSPLLNAGCLLSVTVSRKRKETKKLFMLSSAVGGRQNRFIRSLVHFSIFAQITHLKSSRSMLDSISQVTLT